MQDQSDTQRKRSGYRQLIGYRTRAWREGYGEVELAVGPQHLNAIGIVHGGVYMSLLDVALGHAVAFCTIPGHVRFSTTVSLATSFLKGAKGGVLTGIGRVDGVEGRLATASGEVRDEAGELCALAQANFLYFPGSERPEGVPRR
ncbi:MAG: PaaI family thioesterase [Hyphomonadaceae bacterium]|nr:PaaI family thioesterase [Hyphomonadaceae bacterium]